MNRFFNGQILFASFIFVLNTIYAQQLLKMEMPYASNEPGPSFFPWVLCLVLYILIIIVIIKEINYCKTNQNISKKVDSETIPNIYMMGPIIIFAIIAFFILIFYYVGYILSSLFFSLSISFFFNYEKDGLILENLIISCIIAILVTFTGWLFFVKIFDLYLPL